MLTIGIHHTLQVLRKTTVGLYLGNGIDEVLLPNKYVPNSIELGASIRVFVYLDSSERVIATTLEPLIKLNTFALLKVAQTNDIGAFLYWGLEKHLFVPFNEQATKMIEGQDYVVYCYLDELTDRLIASSKINKFTSNQELTVKKFDEVDLLVTHISDIGVNVIINQCHRGLIYHDELFQPLHIGEQLKGTIKLIRPDHKIDVSLQPIGYKNIEPNAKFLLECLNQQNGFIGLHDNSPAEEIHAALNMSKKNFKKAVGSLFKQKVIFLKENGIQLIIKETIN